MAQLSAPWTGIPAQNILSLAIDTSGTRPIYNVRRRWEFSCLFGALYLVWARPLNPNIKLIYNSKPCLFSITESDDFDDCDEQINDRIRYSRQLVKNVLSAASVVTKKHFDASRQTPTTQAWNIFPNLATPPTATRVNQNPLTQEAHANTS